MSNFNSQIYKSLRAKSANKRKASYDFDRVVSNITEELLPNSSRNKATNTPSREEDIQKVTELYDKKLRDQDRAQNKRFGELSKNSENEISKLGNRVQNSENQNLELSDSLKEAIARLSNNQSNTKEAQPSEEVAGEEEQEVATKQQESSLIEPVAPSVTALPVKNKTTPEIAKVESVIKKIVNIGDSVGVGDHVYKVTNLFGIREGDNSVPGRQGKHSNGMDMVGYSKDGKVSNLPIALTDGKIVGVNMQGDGSVIKPTQGQSAGVYIDLLMPDGKVMKYMHLGKDAMKNKASLLGKEVKRGDILYEGDYSSGSGSQTGPHIKVSITSLDEKGAQLRDYSNPLNDPKTYALYGKYTEEH